MKVLRRQDTDAIIEGRATADHEAVGDFLRTLRTDAACAPIPPPSPRLAATLDGRRPLRPASDPIPPRAPTPLPERLRALRSLRPAAVLVAASAVFFGGLATAGALPGPLQHASADLTQHVGIHLPGAAPARAPHSTVAPGATTPTAAPAPRSEAATTTAPTSTTTRTPEGAPVTVPRAPATVTTPTLPVPAPGTGAGAGSLPIALPLPTLPITLPTLPLHNLPTLPTVPTPRR